MFVIVVGIFASICSMISFIPQAWKIIKTRDTSSLSAPMYAITVMGFCGWTIFGILKEEWPIIVTNFFCLILAVFILVMKILPQRRKNQVADMLIPD